MQWGFPLPLKEGASSLHARGVMPTSSSPNWASMIMGAGPEQHGVTSNATVAYLLGLKPPACWIARPVMEAFPPPG